MKKPPRGKPSALAQAEDLSSAKGDPAPGHAKAGAFFDSQERFDAVALDKGFVAVFRESRGTVDPDLQLGF
jgi:hypothetical protein